MTKQEIIDFTTTVNKKLDSNELTQEEMIELIKKVETEFIKGPLQNIAFKLIDDIQYPELFRLKNSFDVRPSYVEESGWDEFIESGKISVDLYHIENSDYLIDKLSSHTTNVDKKFEVVFDETCYPGLQKELKRIIETYGDKTEILEKAKKQFRERIKDNYFNNQALLETELYINKLYFNLVHKYAFSLNDDLKMEGVLNSFDNGEKIFR